MSDVNILSAESILSQPLAVQVAQRFMVGFSGTEPGEVTKRFLANGLGGVIFFRENFEALTPQEPVSVARLLASLTRQYDATHPVPFLAVDQEGGQVERLYPPLFPALITPRAMALAPVKNPDEFSRELYDNLAYHLALLGFNLDFAPVLDVNLNRQNPIIGVRSFGDDAETVIRFSKSVMDRFRERGIIAVGKHFPGHGNGTVDSHLALPELVFTEEEFKPFEEAVRQGIPAMMVSHGYYPAIQAGESSDTPASASPKIIQELLRNRLGFNGVLFSDDLCMGAVHQENTAVDASIETALKTLAAGVDVLVYKDSDETQWKIFEAVVAALENGQLDRAAHEISLRRIMAAKEKLKPYEPNESLIGKLFSTLSVNALSAYFADDAVSLLDGEPEGILPLDRDWPLLLVHPDRSMIRNYAYDQKFSPELPALLEAAEFSDVTAWAYRVGEAFTLPEEEEPPATIIFVTFNPVSDPYQVELYRELKSRYPKSVLILVSAGTPYDPEVLPQFDLHIGLCTYRPASMQALVNVLASC